MILGRIIRACNASDYSLIRVSRLTKIFVAGDVTCFLIQAMGGGLLGGAKTKKQFDTDNDIILGGLILQIIIFVGFLIVAVVFHRRLQYHQTTEAAGLPWQRLMMMLYASSVLISVRNLYRVIEYAMGQNGWLLEHEWPLYVFDGLLMGVVAFVGLWWYGFGIESVRHSDGKPGRWRRYRSIGVALEEGRGKSTENVPLHEDTGYTGA